jgi:transposase
MKLVYSCCAGLDVHKRSISVCVRVGNGKKLECINELFGTYTAELERLRDFLLRNKVKRIIIESTGVYWIPVWNVLERSKQPFQLVLVNPQHVRALPGHKTDQKDCERLAELGQYDLLRASFIPPTPIRELRDLTRRRTHLQQDRNRLINRIGRLLETANFKLSSVATDIVGKSGWLMLNAIAAGNTDPQQLASLAQGRLQSKKADLVEAMRGYTSEHFRWLLKELLEEIATLDRKLTALEERIRKGMLPHQDLIRRLSTIPGVQETTAWTLIAELGTDMSCFPSPAHAASWAGLCPGNCESAGKRQSGRTRKGNRYLRRMLIQNGWAVSRKRNCFLTALFFRIASRRGLKRASMAVAHRILMIAYFIIRDGAEYREVGQGYYDRQNPEKTARRLTARLERIGYKVALTRVEAAELPAPPPRPKYGTTRWTLAKVPTGAGPAAGLKLPPATPDICRMCAKWGIACIHARNAKPQAQKDAHSSDSAG